ncbi:GerAB/ArcD/ProY family transporter [Paenibacillus arenilitoris]|uniref:GerAB/ArcD/ProY family transporter n=1 Tax=Paenibacillus arenilitoris TaxID=2772299 RepID=A0A927H8U9_9BACL|nr:GerAB/ArcD/ProY family transporter [Paenibacillus arenilitoris]MBD2872073.1 GerAB/ArcD/ProY family transporter [Paenibacillus arenilitoris]
MKKLESVSPMQMGILFFVFMTGSSIINIPAPLIGKAENAAWLSLLISGAAGMAMLVCMLYLHRRFPALSFVQYSSKLVGSWPTLILSILPLSFILHMLTAIVLDIGLFMRSSMMRETPIYAFTFPVFLVAALTVVAGIEVMARMYSLILILIVIFIASVLLLGTEHYNLTFLVPVMPHGIKPMLNGAFFTFGFPYAEVFLFAMLFPFVRKSSGGRLNLVMLLTLILNIVTLCVSTVCTIMMFGPLAGVKKYSLFELARTIDVQEILTRIESVIGLSLIAGSYMKTTITLYVLCLYITHLLKLKDHRSIVMPIALVAFINTLVGFSSDMQWVEIVSVVHPFWGSTAYALPLILITVVAFIRKSVR